MVNPEENKRINQELKELYQSVEKDFLHEYENAFGVCYPSLLHYGIIDVKSYDADNGILAVMKEPNGWDGGKSDSYLDFAWDISNGNGISTLKHGRLTWYNLGRYVTAVRSPERPTSEICRLYADALYELRHAAVTNLNKATGYAASGKEYFKLIWENKTAIKTFAAELEILKPKTILFCLGKDVTWIFGDSFLNGLRDKGCTLITAWHPAATKGNAKMIDVVKEQLPPKG